MKKTEAIKLNNQPFKNHSPMFVSRKVITSDAYLSLGTPAACQVYMIFLSKCQWKQIDPDRVDSYYIANNGQIQFTYQEAEEKWGISESRFKLAIEKLVAVGLIDITHSGYGLQGDKSLYAISDRWEKFGTPEFIHKERPKRKQKFGFQKGNEHGKNTNKKKSTVADEG